MEIESIAITNCCFSNTQSFRIIIVHRVRGPVPGGIVMYKRTQNSFLANGPIEYASTAIFHEPFIISDIERIQNALYKPGIHHFKFEDWATSHLALSTHLQYFNKIVGHLFHPVRTSPSVHIDLYSLLLSSAYLPDNLDEFFIDSTHIELLWIELSTALLASQWLLTFEKNILDFNIQNTIPIIVTSCKDK